MNDATSPKIMNFNNFNVPDIIFDFWIKNLPEDYKLYYSRYNNGGYISTIIFCGFYPLEFRPPDPKNTLALLDELPKFGNRYAINEVWYPEEIAIKVIRLITFI